MTLRYKRKTFIPFIADFKHTCKLLLCDYTRLASNINHIEFENKYVSIKAYLC